jgi:spermidine synthase
MNPLLELFYFRGRWQLATEDALYSDGSAYKPLVKAFKRISNDLKKVRTCVFLGGGLGSGALILNELGYNPEITFVEHDEEVIHWAIELLPDEIKQNTRFLCTDVEDYVKTIEASFDLIVVDIFKGRVVPDFVTSAVFLEKCKKHLNTSGHIVVNYIIPDKEHWKEFEKTFGQVFNSFETIDLGINRVLIAKV